MKAVHEEHLWIANDRAAHRHSLALTAGQRAWPTIEQRVEFEMGPIGFSLWGPLATMTP